MAILASIEYRGRTPHAVDTGDQEDPPRESIAWGRSWLDVSMARVGNFTECGQRMPMF